MKLKTGFPLRITGFALMLALAACTQEQSSSTEASSPATTAPAASSPVTQVAAPVPVPLLACVTCGTVRSITPITQSGATTGAGAAIGAVAGGLAGNQVGGGSGNTIATVAGVIGGAVLGNTIERNRNANTMYEVVIDMETGGQQIITVPDASTLNPGTSVTVDGSNIYRR
ncbi:MAG: glycine zipper 2TM domain-containing protein [Gammaproteobacteria bacterium]|nr:glycine zipper 2TM domain-containing protein [Gammaproteobacteria bacterium]MDP2139840.1 glycine zipper 2TM domain-containing protein [Gammaproteobacteria bacterium]MDP2347081.1 glycine zipper 2TM domain-containing protein [Gammaproteobacteria bacterium]